MQLDTLAQSACHCTMNVVVNLPHTFVPALTPAHKRCPCGEHFPHDKNNFRQNSRTGIYRNIVFRSSAAARNTRIIQCNNCHTLLRNSAVRRMREQNCVSVAEQGWCGGQCRGVCSYRQSKSECLFMYVQHCMIWLAECLNVSATNDAYNM